ncbi:N-acetylmuramoyl-L-alanine amidase [Parapedobacter lycopersici]|uniref:N-acetylmuramoyl-L-alanine amidase n=1 Tax=Parapedobacter lycopersici TaxID=1864939 RepID=UPI00214DC0EF|nr:N-acetylmuramoyl-L-alanine amidase [Parapedobacter lycopersici]
MSVFVYRRYDFALLLSACLVLAGCSTNRYAKTNKQYTEQVKALAAEIRQPLPPPLPAPTATYDSLMDTVVFSPRTAQREQPWVGTINFNLRKPNYVVIHHTAQDSLEQTLHTFTVPHTQVSAHYVIGRDGEVYQLLNDYLRGWHAGAGKWGNVTDLNSVSLGIELDNNGSEPFPDAQIYSLLQLLEKLKTTYRIPAVNFLAHGDIAPTRKNDPSVLFPWEKLAERGFGLWPDEHLEEPPANFNPRDALRIIGYDISDLNAAIVAFKRRYIQQDLSPELTPHDLQVLYNLYLKY